MERAERNNGFAHSCHLRLLMALVIFVFMMIQPATATAKPTLKGPLSGIIEFDPDDSGFAVVEAAGHLTLMGKVVLYAEFVFVPGALPGTFDGTGIAAFVAANGDVLVANVLWEIDADGEGRLEFRWPGQITFSDGTMVQSTGRFTDLPFAGLRGTSSLTLDFTNTSPGVRITMTGDIIDPDPLD